MLEGKEIVRSYGENGSAYVDLKPNGELEIGLVLKANLFTELRKLAAKTDNKLDDLAIDYIERLVNTIP